MAIIEVQFDFCADKQRSVPQYKQIDEFTMWVEQYYPEARFYYPKRPSQGSPYRPFHHGNRPTNRHPFTVIATVTVETSRFASAVEAILETIRPTGMRMVSTVTESELRHMGGWDDRLVDDTGRMMNDADRYPTRFIKWSSLSSAGLRLRSVEWGKDPLELSVNWVLAQSNAWSPWVPDHPYFTDPTYERVPF